jgi:hypothetical protein
MSAIFVLSLSLLLSPPLSPPTVVRAHRVFVREASMVRFVRGGSGGDCGGDCLRVGGRVLRESCAQPRHCHTFAVELRAPGEYAVVPAAGNTTGNTTARPLRWEIFAPYVRVRPLASRYRTSDWTWSPRSKPVLVVARAQYVHAQAHRLHVVYADRLVSPRGRGAHAALEVDLLFDGQRLDARSCETTRRTGEPNAAWRELLLSMHCTLRVESSDAMHVLATRYHEPAVAGAATAVAAAAWTSVAGTSGGYEHGRAFEAWHVPLPPSSPRSPSSPPSRPRTSSSHGLLVLSGGAVSATRPRLP